MRIWFISDTHNRHDELEVPHDVDVVVHCGDESSARNVDRNELEARKFLTWYADLDIPRKFFVPGNHSTAIEHGSVRPEEYPGVTFLIHAAGDCNGLKLFGSPYTPLFFSWAYNVARPDLDAIWATIPAKLDVLITHGPPKGILDVTRDWRTREPIHIGSQSLMQHVVERIRPKIHAFGHLHDEPEIHNYGAVVCGPTRFINCSCCSQRGKLVHHGQVVEVE